MLKNYLLIFVIGLQAAWTGLSSLSNEKPDYNGYKVANAANETSNIEIKPINLEFLESADYQTLEKKIEEMGITVHPGTDYSSDSAGDPISKKHCAELIYRTLQIMPEETVEKLENLTMYFNSSGRRGLGGGSTIILRCQNVTDKELVAVLVHELGHIADTGVMKGNFWSGESEFMDGKNPVYNDDLSLDFYRISFFNEKELRSESNDLDFVSGYALSDPFEDFAESYTFYILHGNEFRQLAAENYKLALKYKFLKEKVFNGKEYDKDDNSLIAFYNQRNYDTTVLDFDLKKFLAI